MGQVGELRVVTTMAKKQLELLVRNPALCNHGKGPTIVVEAQVIPSKNVRNVMELLLCVVQRHCGKTHLMQFVVVLVFGVVFD